MGANGSNPQNLTSSSTLDDTSPAFSPDGSQIAFTRAEDIGCAPAPGCTPSFLYVMGADGSNPTVQGAGFLSSNETRGATDPQYSPAGDRIVFGKGVDIFSLAPGGTGPQNLTAFDTRDVFAPALSPDGLKLAYAREANPAPPPFTRDIRAIALDGSTVADLTTGQSEDDHSPAFSPDGMQIAFETSRATGTFDREIAVMPVAGIGPTGMNQTRPTAAFTSSDTNPDWQPIPVSAPPGSPPGEDPPGSTPDTEPPETTITKQPKDKVEASTAKYKFSSSEAGSTFECKRDRKSFTPCTSPTKLKHLDDGKHRFQVRATDATGNTDPSPAKDRFNVVG